jgi:hypothetical protein
VSIEIIAQGTPRQILQKWVDIGDSEKEVVCLIWFIKC